MIGRALAVVVFFVGLAFWAAGGWQVYESNTVFGALLVLAGGVLVIGVIAWWRRDADAAFEAVWQGIMGFFSRA